jgi:hypothetical protein
MFNYIEPKANDIDSMFNYIERKANDIGSMFNYIERKANDIEPKANDIDSMFNYIEPKANDIEPMFDYIDRKANDIASMFNYMERKANDIEPMSNYIDRKTARLPAIVLCRAVNCLPRVSAFFCFCAFLDLLIANCQLPTDFPTRPLKRKLNTLGLNDLVGVIILEIADRSFRKADNVLFRQSPWLPIVSENLRKHIITPWMKTGTVRGCGFYGSFAIHHLHGIRCLCFQ